MSVSGRGRREVLLLLAGALAKPSWVVAQTTARKLRLGTMSLVDIRREPYAAAFDKRLAELGFADGSNFSVIFRHADGRLGDVPSVAEQLAKMDCDVYFGAGNEANLVALRQATRDRPIVFLALDFDLVANRHIDSMARPGGRITGLTAIESALPAKRLEVLKDLMPGTRRVAVFSNEQTASGLEVAQKAAKALGLHHHVVDFKRPPFDLEAGFADAIRAKCDSLLLLTSVAWVPMRQKFTELAAKARLPGMFPQAQWVSEGGLVSYGYNFPAIWRRSAEIVVQVLRGARPADIPVEEPATYELAVNLKAASALGLKISGDFLHRVDRIIE